MPNLPAAHREWTPKRKDDPRAAHALLRPRFTTAEVVELFARWLEGGPDADPS